MKNRFIATPSQVANVILTLAFRKTTEYKLTPYKLGKMVYMIYAWYYAISGAKLFSDPILIGENGPIVKEVDNQFSSQKNNIIPNGMLASTYNVDLNMDVGNLVDTNPEHLLVINIANTVLEFYKNENDTDLRSLTHAKGSVWYIETNNGKELQDKVGQPVSNYEAIKRRAEESIERYKATQGL